jgi:hydrogenase expression/formation protein HypD
MEVCGGQTHTIARYGLDQCLTPTITLLHGPGCPVCVTPAATLDAAQELAAQPDVILCSFGDMLRVPGSTRTLLDVKAAGGDVRTLYSPLDALGIARQHPHKEVVLFAIGFETTAPLTALTILQAQEEQIENFSVLCAHVLIPPAIESLLQSSATRIDALLAPGHVCTVTGTAAYDRLQAAYDLPMAVTGFEPADILQGIKAAVQLLQNHQSKVVISYARSVTAEGNLPAQRLIERVFTVTDRDWRGLGGIPGSGLEIGADYATYDASRRFGLTLSPRPPETDHCALVLRGALAPTACPEFRRGCTPDHPKGAPMVSTEGACAAYTQHARTGRAVL